MHRLLQLLPSLRVPDCCWLPHSLCILQMYKVDASEGSLLQKKYSFRTVPM